MSQDYQAYTAEDHEVWSLLYNRQIGIIKNIASQSYLDGMVKCGFKPKAVPRFDEVNIELDKATGWQIYVVPGLIDNKPFFQHLAKRQFPATTWLRSKAKLDYLEEPDMFHDVFGHIPLLSESNFCQFLQGISEITLAHINNPHIVEIMARLYWYTVEFGLIREGEDLKIYGAGILSSSGESVFSLSDEAVHLAFDIEKIVATPYIKDKYQAQYFVIDSYEQLNDSLSDIAALVDREVNRSEIAA